MVVSGHLCTALVPWLHQPANSPKEPPSIFQLPFFRLAVGGRSAVAIFFLVTGYVNSIGPISKSRAGNNDAAFMGIARSALARSGRLVLPTMLATFITWFLANTNAYHMTKHVDSTWIRQGWHRQEPTVYEALKSLIKAQTETWTIGWNDYDGTQWTLHLFLEGSMLVYTTMFATVLVKPKARLIIYAALYLYFWQLGEGKLPHSTPSGMLCPNIGRTRDRRTERLEYRDGHVRRRIAQPLQRFRNIGPACPGPCAHDYHGNVLGRLPSRQSTKCAVVARYAADDGEHYR
jgi:hypothetical protein